MAEKNDYPTPPAPPEEPEDKVGKEKAELLKKLGEVLKEFKNRESDIPPSHEYWDWLNRFRSLGK